MTVKDIHGLEMTGASVRAAELYQTARERFHAYAGDSFTPLMGALADSPAFVMAHVLKAWMTVIAANTHVTAMGVAAFETARTLPMNAREAGHVAAIGALLAGEVRAAARILQDVAADYPHDVLALQTGQTLDFLQGDSRMLRDRIEAVLPHWSPDRPEWHAILGLHAFGLEETGHFDRAEAAGRACVALEPANNWGQHAVAHVMVMQGRHADGVRWMRHENTAWQPEAQLGVHNWWHTALFHLGLGETDAVLQLYDGPIYGEDATTFAFDMVDSAALLWRLQLLGVDVGERWTRLADNFATEPHGRSAFVDTHAMLAYVGAGQTERVRALLDSQGQAIAGPGDNAAFVREAGLPACEAIAAFGEGRFARAVELLSSVRGQTHRFGGSHAQRDVLDLTLIAAARAAGDEGLAQALLAERAGGIPLPEYARSLAA
ncbi:tetratricopeptide repeat protein [Phenylobacterium sp.]|uniref:tetratricopeptide repeat protein n=1 Tax=Phenylobacterium sp. TaxID=1871053 RepID=UPI003D280C3E